MTIRVAEAIFSGHPDRLADRLADRLRDEALKVDPEARVGIEVTLTGRNVILAGEISVDLTTDVISAAIRDILKLKKVNIHNFLRPQSKELARISGQGAGDQAIVVGYACRETRTYEPFAHRAARDVVEALEEEGYGPDGKVMVLYRDLEDVIVRVNLQGDGDEGRVESIVQDVLPTATVATHFFKKGGLDADTGVSGRKLIADAYGPHVPHGGGSTHGKDKSKPDYGAWELARQMAISHLHTTEAKSCTITLVYKPGSNYPMIIKEYTH